MDVTNEVCLRTDCSELKSRLVNSDTLWGAFEVYKVKKEIHIKVNAIKKKSKSRPNANIGNDGNFP